MALLLLFVSFFTSLLGVWLFIDGYFLETVPARQMVQIIAGMAVAVIPYMVARSVSELIAIRQRHLMLEQTTLQQRIMLEAMDEAAREYERETGEKPVPPPVVD